MWRAIQRKLQELTLKMQMSLGAARSQAVSPIADKQNGLLGKPACQLDGSANMIFFGGPQGC